MTAVLPFVGTAISFLGSMKQAQAAKAAGKAQQQEAYYRATQAEMAAGQTRASGQRAAIEQRRKGEIARSRAIALQAGQGGSTADPTFINIVGDLGTETEYSAMSALFQGEDEAAGLEQQAGLSRFEGDSAYRAGKAESKSLMLAAAGKAATSLMDKYAPVKTTNPTLRERTGNIGRSVYGSSRF